MRRFLIPPGLIPSTQKGSSSTTATTASSSSTTTSTAGATTEVTTTASITQDEPVAKRSRPSTETTTAISVSPHLPPTHIRYEDHINMLSPTQQSHALTCPTHQWIELPGALIYLQSSPYRIGERIKPVKGVIAFDMDGTLIATKSGKRFPTNQHDWKFWDSSVPQKLYDLHEEGYLLAIISNQGGLSQKSQNANELKEKVVTLLSTGRLQGLPIDFICASDSGSVDVFRKPRTGMWDYLSIARWNAYEQALGSDTFKRVYVGDAAGRLAQGTKAKDHSDTDLKLAVNLGIDFQTPEKFFLSSSMKIHCDLSQSLNTAIRLVDMVSECYCIY